MVADPIWVGVFLLAVVPSPSWPYTFENTDIVLWYTLGIRHVVRAEDWPVLATEWAEFELRPFDFFQRNPALDLPRSAGE